MTLSRLNQERLSRFKSNKRGYWSLILFSIIFFFTLFSEFFANDKPLLIYHDNSLFFPIFKSYSETDFGGEFNTEADYRDPYLIDLVNQDGWILNPLIPFSYNTINFNLKGPAPSPPDRMNWLGTDDRGRDVAARLLYGFRISVFFGFALTFFSSIVGISAGANVAAARKLAGRKDFEGKTIVTVGCDTGERYLSTWLFQEEDK